MLLDGLMPHLQVESTWMEDSGLGVVVVVVLVVEDSGLGGWTQQLLPSPSLTGMQ